MAKIAISAHCIQRIPKLEKSVRKKLEQLTGTFARSTAQELRDMKGTHLESYKNARDDRARTARVTDNFRAILCDTGGETFVLYDVLKHDDADRWMAKNRFQVNPRSGAFEVVNFDAVSEATTTIAVEDDGDGRLYEHRKDKDFTQLGVSEEWVPLLRQLTDEDQILPLIGFLPESQAGAIYLLAGKDSVEDIYREIAGSIDPETIDTEDLEAALDRPASQESFQVFANEQEVQDQLERPFSSWRNYLHHSQKAIAYREEWSGPVRVTGGAGTGKTVVAIHRARALAERLGDASGKPILFTTYTRNLAEAIEEQLRQLGGPELLDKIDVVNVDRLASRFVSTVNESRVRPIFSNELEELWDRIRLENEGLDQFSAPFLNSEWEQVVLASADCTTRSQYFAIQRNGRGVPLDRRGRAKVWKAIELMMQQLVDDSRQTPLQLAEQARGHLDRLDTKPYQHVIVDEAQDLHEAQWRMLRAAVAEGVNDMFIVGDSHQRIYDRRSSLSKCGIKIVGRSFKLKKNYRTTAQILRWAMAMLGEGDFDDLDAGVETQTFAGYHSVISGPEPVMQGYRTPGKQLDSAVDQVKSWVEDGIEPHEIGIAARTNGSLMSLERRMRAGGVATEVLEKKLPREDGVKLGTMHRLKGLEFRAVLVIDVDDDSLPLPAALTSKFEDEVQYREDLQRELCLLYVAVTRAREALTVTWSGEPSRYLGAVLGPVPSES